MKGGIPVILVIGASASGKRTYVKSLGYVDADMADAVLDERPVLFNLQDMISAAPDSGDALLPRLIEKQVVICNEVGSGVIPAESDERQARVKTGRLCILLAQNAQKVVRLVSGIPTVIKENL